MAPCALYILWFIVEQIIARISLVFLFFLIKEEQAGLVHAGLGFDLKCNPNIWVKHFVDAAIIARISLICFERGRSC